MIGWLPRLLQAAWHTQSGKGRMLVEGYKSIRVIPTSIPTDIPFESRILYRTSKCFQCFLLTTRVFHGILVYPDMQAVTRSDPPSQVDAPSFSELLPQRDI